MVCSAAMGTTCWFCEERPAVETASVHQTVIRPRALTYELKEAEVVIARCAECQTAQEDPLPDGNTWTLIAMSAVLVGGLAWWSRLMGWEVTTSEALYQVLLAGAALGAGLGGLVQGLMDGATVDRRCRRIGSRPPRDVSEHPDVVAVFAAGEPLAATRHH